MLLINQWLDKLAASCIDFERHGMLQGTCLSIVVEALGKVLIKHFACTYTSMILASHKQDSDSTGLG